MRIAESAIKLNHYYNLLIMIFFTNKYIGFLRSLGKILALKTALSLFIAINLFHSEAYSQNAQTRRVSGQVTDESSGETLVGATVKVQGADNSVTVDREGKFSIGVPNANSVLVVTFTGYTEQQVPAGRQDGTRY